MYSAILVYLDYDHHHITKSNKIITENSIRLIRRRINSSFKNVLPHIKDVVVA